MAHLNTRIDAPHTAINIWVGAVGANTSLVGTGSDTGLAARAVVVGVAAGSLVLVDIYGNVRTVTVADIIAQNYIIRGQWVQVTAAGSAAHTLTIWW
jgi:hypothetical protein